MEDNEENIKNERKFSQNTNRSELFEKRVRRSKTVRGAGKYDYTSINSLIRSDSDFQSSKINSNNFFKPSKNDLISGKKSKDSINQSSNINTVSHENIVLNYFGHMKIPLEYFEDNRFELINSYGHCTEAGLNFNRTKKINQDCYIIRKNIFGYKNFYLLSVLDGHGNKIKYSFKIIKIINR